jgi:hypothetical protein
MNNNLEFTGYWKQTDNCGSDSNHPISGGSAYFNIADAILFTRQYADGLRDGDDAISMVDVQWPDSEWSHYDSFWSEITLSPDHGFRDSTIVHEYGHHLESEISTGDDYWGDGSHNFCTYGKDEEFAWKEGFSEYLDAIVTYHYPFWLTPNPNRNQAQMETPTCSQYGEEGEATVATLLWDLVDDSGANFPNSTVETFDTIDGMEALIFGIFDDELDDALDAPGLCDFIDEGWNCRLGGASKSAIEPLLNQFSLSCSDECDD